MDLFQFDWAFVFAPDLSLVETFVRGTVLYFAVLILLRSSLRRSAGELAMQDFIFVLLVANAAADSMTGGSLSIANSVLLVATVVGWNYALNSLSYFFPLVERLVSPPPLMVVRNGKMLHRNMRREFLTEKELLGRMREQGVDDVAKVKRAYIEGDGNISVIPVEG